jgi:hypothetical protein
MGDHRLLLDGYCPDPAIRIRHKSASLATTGQIASSWGWPVVRGGVHYAFSGHPTMAALTRAVY